jgi:hypothetical protein
MAVKCFDTYFMLTFIQFLNEDLLLEGKYLYGINHTDSGAGHEIVKLAKTLGYDVSQGRTHIQIHAPDTGEHVTALSVGTVGIKRFRDALKRIHDHQVSIGGFSGFDHNVKTIKKSL